MPQDQQNKAQSTVRMFHYFTAEEKILCALAHRLGIPNYLNYILNNNSKTLLGLIEKKQLIDVLTTHRLN